MDSVEIKNSATDDKSVFTLEKLPAATVAKDEFQGHLMIFQEGIQNLESGARLLNKLLRPTRPEMWISMISAPFSERLRLRRLLNLDLETTQKRLVKKSKETLSSLDRIIELLDERYSASSKNSLIATSELHKYLKMIEQLKTEEAQINEDMKTATGEVDENTTDIEKATAALKIRKVRKRHQDNILLQEKCKAQIKTSQSYAKSEGTHAEYSFGMLKKLLPIQELISVNKEILHNRIEMLNRMVAAGTILKPLGELSQELGTVSLQFAEANMTLNNMMEEIQISY